MTTSSFSASSSVSLAELASLVSGEIFPAGHGHENLQIALLNGIERASSSEITFINTVKHIDQIHQTRASACIVPHTVSKADLPEHMPVILAENVDVAAAQIQAFLLQTPFEATGIHPSAVIGQECSISPQVSIGANASIGNGVSIGDEVSIGAGVVIEDGCDIGAGTIIHSRVVVAKDCIIGKNVILHHGCVIGSDGFGFATDKQGFHYKKPQVGIVRIDDDAEVGANTCVDRAAFGVTWVKSGARIDNLVQVGHNVVVGENSVLVAQVGIAGSTTLGRSVVLGGQTAVRGHLQIGDGVMAAACSGIINDQPAGSRIGGAPATDARTWARTLAAYKKLPQIVSDIRALRKELDALQEATKSKEEGQEEGEKA